MRKDTLEKYDKYVRIINDLSDSIGITILDNDIYEILLSFELLENDILLWSDIGLHSNFKYI